MSNSSNLKSYWDTNLDPFNWKDLEVGQVPFEWKKAVSVYLAPEVKYALSKVGDLKGKRVLLLGCGLGQGSIPLARLGAEVTGADISEERIEQARRLTADTAEGNSISFRVADAVALPFADASFDLVLGQDVLMYASPREVTDECSRVLCLDGKAVFIESLKSNPFVQLFRRVGYGAQTESFTKHLSWDELRGLESDRLVLLECRVHYYFAVISFAVLYLLRNVLLYRLTLSVLYPFDRLLLRLMPFLARKAWKGVAVYRRR